MEPTNETDPLAINSRLSRKVDAFSRDSRLNGGTYRFWGDEFSSRRGNCLWAVIGRNSMPFPKGFLGRRHAGYSSAVRRDSLVVLLEGSRVFLDTPGAGKRYIFIGWLIRSLKYFVKSLEKLHTAPFHSAGPRL